jgi:protein-disulfide isomerase
LKVKDDMLNKNNKGLTIVFIALIIIGAIVFFLSKGASIPTEPPPVAQAAAEQKVSITDPAHPELETPQVPPVDITAPQQLPVAAPATDKAAAAPAPQEQNASSPSLLAPPAALTIDVAAAMKDRVIGNDNAPVTIVEYASLTCPHCAHFEADILPTVKKNLIDTGKAKLIFRDFPLDNFALKAAMMTRCVPAAQYFSLLEVVFTQQERWTQSKDPLESLAQLGSLAGMDPDLFKACTQNTVLETAILDGLKEAQSKYQSRSTPTFVFNNGAETLSGAQGADQFDAIVKKLTGEK